MGSYDATYQSLPLSESEHPAFLHQSQHKWEAAQYAAAECTPTRSRHAFATPPKQEHVSPALLAVSESPVALRASAQRANLQNKLLFAPGGALNSQTGEGTYIDHLGTCPRTEHDPFHVKSEPWAAPGDVDPFNEADSHDVPSGLDDAALIRHLKTRVAGANRVILQNNALIMDYSNELCVMTAERDLLQGQVDELDAELKQWKLAAQGAKDLARLLKPFAYPE
ncbi:hypothetical protein GGX14DRAFT_563740 [Mycena pura]|uniref:Uncharacterized protein n=1 Tax=Mycena pura TaxID=153505 RepID=A0AAD6VHY1_9AGAR|nr:hypothetical protein GGX14DRAFT_563740 [Mycena pura]